MAKKKMEQKIKKKYMSKRNKRKETLQKTKEFKILTKISMIICQAKKT